MATLVEGIGKIGAVGLNTPTAVIEVLEISEIFLITITKILLSPT